MLTAKDRERINSKETQLEKLTAELSIARENRQKCYEIYQKTAISEQKAKEALMFELQRLKLKSARTEDFTATIAQRENIKITHEQSVIDWLKEQPNIETDVYIGIKKLAFDGLAKNILKKTGEVIPGTNIEVNEYLSLRKSDKERSK